MPFILSFFDKINKLPGIIGLLNWFQRRINIQKPPKRWKWLDELSKYENRKSLVTLFLTHSRMIQVKAVTDQIWEIKEISKLNEKVHSWSVTHKVDNSVKIDIKCKSDSILLTPITDNSDLIKIKIDKNPVRFSFLDTKNRVLQTDLQQGGIGFGKGKWKHLYIKHSNSNAYGLGEKSGILNKNGKKWIFWNTDNAQFEENSDPLYKSIPFALFTGSNEPSHGLFIDNPGYQVWDLSENPREIKISIATGKIQYYFIGGKNAKTVIQNFTLLTGRMPLPPIWALGYQQCRWSYFPDNRVIEIAKEFRARNIPCDVLYLDIDYMDDHKCFTWNKKYFPNPKKMIKELKKMGYKVILIIDPGIKVDSSYQIDVQGKKQNHFLKKSNSNLYVATVWPGSCHFPDFLKEKTRDWWGSLYQGFVGDGIDGFWNDMNEPSIFSLRRTMANDVVHKVNDYIFYHGEVHNVYGMEMVKATYEGLRKLKPKKRHFVLSRSAYAGTQRYAWTWTGDNKSSWSHLQLSIPKCLNLGISGLSGVGPDIGGFRGSPTPELYARWIQLGVFYPLCRTHTIKDTPNQEPWSFGTDVENIARKYIELRYRLMPYIYTNLQQSTINGIPLMRPLFLEYPDDPNCFDPKWENTEFFFGPSLLITPILVEGAKSREIYLPEGKWYEFETLKEYQGNQVITVDAPIHYIPVFVKDGSIIPMRKESRSNVVDNLSVPLEFKTFGSIDEPTNLVYLDDGISLDFEDGNYGLYKIGKKGELELVKGNGLLE